MQEYRNIDLLLKDGESEHHKGLPKGHKDFKTRVHNDYHSGCIHKIECGKIEIVRYDLSLAEHHLLHFKITEHQVVMVFDVEGSITITMDSLAPITIHSGMHNIAYCNPMEGAVRLSKGKIDLFYVVLPLSLFKQYFPRDEEAFEAFDQKMNAGLFSVLRDGHGVLNHDIYKVIEAICRCDQQKNLKKIFIQAKIIELLSLQLNQMCTICCSTCMMRKETIDRMYEVRDFLQQNLNGNYTLKYLAKMVGTNDFTLKKEFKELFGTTVFGFWTDVKMEKAQELLVQGEMAIKQISEVVGYKNPQHFTAAFKRKFGVAPSQYRKKMNLNLRTEGVNK